MSSGATAELSEVLLIELSQGMPAQLLTVGEDGYPYCAFTWAVAVSRSHIHFAVDHRSTSIRNLVMTRCATVQVIGENDLLYLIKGKAQIPKFDIAAAPFDLAMGRLIVTEVKNQAWPVVTVTPLRYEWTAAQRDEMLAVERAVYAEMREWRR